MTYHIDWNLVGLRENPFTTVPPSNQAGRMSHISFSCLPNLTAVIDEYSHS